MFKYRVGRSCCENGMIVLIMNFILMMSFTLACRLL